MGSRRLLLLLAFLLLPSVALATPATQYVTTPCTFNGDGTAAGCAASGGAAGAFNSFANWVGQNLTLTTTMTVNFSGTFATCGTIGGWTTTNTNRLKIVGLKCVGTTYAEVLQLNQNFTDFSQVTSTKNTTGAQKAVTFYATSVWVNGTLDGLIVGKEGTWTLDAGSCAARIDSVANSARTIRNCLVYGGVSTGMEFPTLGGSTQVLDNCTFVGNANDGVYLGVDGGSSPGNTYINNLSTGNGGVAFSSSWASTTNHSGNVSSDTTSPDVAGRSKTLTYTNSATHDYTLASSDTAAIGQGTDLSGTFTTSLNGLTRSAPYDVGAYAYVSTLASYPTSAIPTDFKLWWYGPVRAYTGVPTTWRVIFYEYLNRPVVWTMTGAPTGMVIDATTGVISYPNPIAGTTAGIVVTGTRASCVTIPPWAACSLTVSQTFSLTVGTSDFLFVAPTTTTPAGNDANACTRAAPCATVQHAMGLVGSGDGKTVYLRGGTIVDPWTSGTTKFGSTFTAADFAEVRSYPGEWGIIDASSGGGGPQFDDLTTYGVMDNFEVIGGSSGDRGGIVLRGNHVIAADIIAHGAKGSQADNNSNFNNNAADDAVIARSVGYHARSSDSVSVFNEQNFLSYDESTGYRWFLNNKSYDSNIGYKVKHDTVATGSIFHDNECNNVSISCLRLMSQNASVRFMVSVNAPNTGITVGTTDPTTNTDQGMFLEHNTLTMGSAANGCIEIQSGYARSGPLTGLRNICYQANGGCSSGRGDISSARKMLYGWIDTNGLATVQAYPFNWDYNVWYSSGGASLTNCFQAGNNGAAVLYDLTGWKALIDTNITRDPHAITGDPVFSNLASGLLYVTSTSPAKISSTFGDYAGAFQPDRVDYGVAGTQNTTRLNFDGSDVPAPTPTPTPSVTTSISAALINLICRRHRDDN